MTYKESKKQNEKHFSLKGCVKDGIAGKDGQSLWKLNKRILDNGNKP